jgi:HPr kinase/phosphorylase
MTRADTIHASAVLVGECGIVVRGASGAGKSSLVAELLMLCPDAAWLVADDRVAITVNHGRLVADVPDEIAGLLEVRGVGIVRLPHVAPVVVRLMVDLAPAEACPRLPEIADGREVVCGVELPRLTLPSGLPGAANRVIGVATGLLQAGG